MIRKALGVACGLAVVAVVLNVGLNRANSAAQILARYPLKYVKHVNDLPDGTTTLWARSDDCQNTSLNARISFQARADNGAELSKTIFASFRGGEEKKFVLDWGQPITDLNFIQITPIGSRTGSCGNGSSGTSNGSSGTSNGSGSSGTSNM